MKKRGSLKYVMQSLTFLACVTYLNYFKELCKMRKIIIYVKRACLKLFLALA